MRPLARTMAAEFAPQGIRVNALCPGIVPTQFFTNSNIGENGYGGFEEMFVGGAPLGRAGTALEMASAAVYLASDESSFMTAADHVVDGGWMKV